MNYSRRQLEALGETLGECVTRKEGGRVIYGGGGSSSAPSTQTQVSDLPDWAKGYAQRTLESTEKLTAAPYQAYGAPRIAGFSPMQQQAQEAAAGLGTSGQLGTATGLSTAAGLMGLGANYQPGYFGNQFRAPAAYQPGQFSMLQAQAPELQQFQMGPAERVGTGSFTQPGAAAQYMSPFIEQALAPQLREAQRTSEMQRAADQAQAVRSGAFGGSRQAIIEAERQRNLATQMGDIRARGLQTAFEQAQGLYGTEAQRQLAAQQANQQAGLTVGGQNLAALLGIQQLGAGQSMQAQLANQQALQAAQQAAEQSRQFGYGQGMTAAQQRAQFGQAAQQLGEQSRQYGAGYGLQGLGTALQAAGQLGNLGQAEFGQAKDIIGLQSQLGAQQQALRQQGLTQAYQDFLNEQNYPYKQLGFMSDMIRGLPLGQQSTRQVYEPPGSIAGQLGGIGMGMYGLSRAFGGFAEGGQVDGYADGGVTSDYNVDDIISKLSDVQLQQSKLAALNRGDREQAAMIDDEMAERASLRAGLGGAFNMLPEDTQEAVTDMAGGGIVAFAGPTEDNNYSLVEDPQFGGGQGGGASTNPLMNALRMLDVGRLVRGGKSIEEYYGEPAFGSSASSPSPDSISAAFADESRKSDVVPRTRVEKKAKPTPAKPRASAPSASITQAAEQMADKAGVDKETFLDKFKQLRDEFNASSKKEMEALLADAEKTMGGSKEVKERAFGEAVAKYGFEMARAASKRGATFLSSVSEAAPTLAASMAESAKLAREMNQNDMKLRMSLKQFEIAQRKGDMQTAASLAAQIRALEQSQAQLGLQREQLAEQKRSSQVKEGLMRQRIAAAGPAALAKSSAAIMKNYETSRNRALERARQLAKTDFEAAALNPTMQKMFQERGITSSAQLYELYADRELGKLNKDYLKNVTPDDPEDDDNA